MSFPDQLEPYKLTSKQWPPHDAVYTIKIEDAPVVTFLKRYKSTP